MLNYNSYDMTVRCVDGLVAFDFGCHIIIVDNCSPDGSYERLRGHYSDSAVDVIKTGRNGGYGAGNNYGIHYAIDRYEVEVFAILNPDVIIPDADMIPRMTDKLMSDESYAIIGGMIVDHDGSYNLNYSGWNIPDITGLVDFVLLHGHRYRKSIDWPDVGDGLKRVDCVAGCFFMMKSACMREIGFFDESLFLYFEEISIGIRCKDKGYLTVIDTDARYYHEHVEPDNNALTFREKVGVTRSSYDSAKYICRNYYSSMALPLIWCAEMYNRLYLAVAYILHRIIRSR